MSLGPEEIRRREEALRRPKGQIVTRVRVTRVGSLILPRFDGEKEEEAVFKEMTFGDREMIEQACRYETERDDGGTQWEVDYNEVRRLHVKRNLLSWSLNVPIERENGWMTHESYERIGRVYGPLLDAFMDAFWAQSEITEEEVKTIGRQAAVLFGKNSRGVTDACEAVKLYCTLSSQWEKFGVTDEDLAQMPYRRYLMLRTMSQHESEALRRNTAPKNTPNTKIAGRGGRTRPSQGKKIPL